MATQIAELTLLLAEYLNYSDEDLDRLRADAIRHLKETKLTVTESLPKSRAISFAIFVWLWTKSLDMPSMNTPSI